MPVYIYETVPENKGIPVRRFEVRQSMSEPALKKDPETGEPVRRVITGGLDIPRAPTDIRKVPKPSGAASGCHPASCSCCRPGIRPKW